MILPGAKGETKSQILKTLAIPKDFNLEKVGDLNTI
jgi:hypothetical protein